MGGTFMSLPADYRDYFVRNLHDALSGHASADVREAVRFSEQSRTKCIGLTIETRPDYCLPPHLSQMLSYGCTRYETLPMHQLRSVLIDLYVVHASPVLCLSISSILLFPVQHHHFRCMQ